MKLIPSILVVASAIFGSACASSDPIATEDGTALPANGETASAEEALNVDFATTRVWRLVGTTLQVRDGAAAYATVDASVAEAALTADRIVIRRPNGSVWAKEGALSSPWVSLAGPGAALEIAAASTLVALRTPAGAILVKRGALNAPWVTFVAGGAKQVELAGCGLKAYLGSVAHGVSECELDSRVGYIDATNTFRLRSLRTAAWSVIAANVAEISMDGSNVGYRTLGNAVFAKRGDLAALATPFVPLVASGATHVAAGFYSAGYVTAGGSAYARTSQNTAPTLLLLATNAQALSLTGGGAAIRRPTGALLSRTIVTNVLGPMVNEGAGGAIGFARRCRLEAAVQFTPPNTYYTETDVACD